MIIFIRFQTDGLGYSVVLDNGNRVLTVDENCSLTYAKNRALAAQMFFDGNATIVVEE